MLKWFLWSVLLLLALLFFLPTRLEFTYLGSGLTIKARLLYLLRFTLLPQKPRAKKPKKAPQKKKAKPSKKDAKPSAQKPSLLLMDILQTLNDLLPLLGRCLDYWLRHITLHRCWVRVLVHQEEAADTGIRCGQLNALGYTLYAWCASRIRIRNFCFNVVPNFAGEEESLHLQLDLSISLAAVVWGLVLFLCRGGMSLLQGPLLASREKPKKKQPKADSSPSS